MDCAKTGEMIRSLRKEKGLTQQRLADQLRISPKTISKWEQGRGAPDVSLWPALSAILGADMHKLIAGQMQPNRRDGGKVRSAKFYVCPLCGSIHWGTGEAELLCCGRRVEALTPIPAPEMLNLKGEEIDGEMFVTFQHPMTKTHHVAFAALVKEERVIFIRLYPEQNPEFDLPFTRGLGMLYLYDTQEGLFRTRYPLRNADPSVPG